MRQMSAAVSQTNCQIIYVLCNAGRFDRLPLRWSTIQNGAIEVSVDLCFEWMHWRVWFDAVILSRHLGGDIRIFLVMVLLLLLRYVRWKCRFVIILLSLYFVPKRYRENDRHPCVKFIMQEREREKKKRQIHKQSLSHRCLYQSTIGTIYRIRDFAFSLAPACQPTVWQFFAWKLNEFPGNAISSSPERHASHMRSTFSVNTNIINFVVYADIVAHY